MTGGVVTSWRAGSGKRPAAEKTRGANANPLAGSFPAIRQLPQQLDEIGPSAEGSQVGVLEHVGAVVVALRNCPP